MRGFLKTAGCTVRNNKTNGAAAPKNSTRLFAALMERPLFARLFSGQLIILLCGEALLLALLAFLSPSFFRAGTIQSMLFQLPEVGLLTLAMMIPIITGGINLAIITTANIGGLLFAYLMSLSSAAGVGPGAMVAIALAAGLAASIVIGCVIGGIVAYFRVHPILASLGMMTLLEGIGLLTTRGKGISSLPPFISAIGNETFLGLPLSLWLLGAAVLAMAFLMRRTQLGVSFYMIGSNTKAAEYSGINTKRALVLCYVVSSVLAFVAGLVMMSRFNSARIDYGESYLLLTVLVCVLGGIDPAGGRGSVSGVVMAMIVIQTLASGLNSLRFSPHLAMAFNGIILIAVFVIARLRQPKTT